MSYVRSYQEILEIIDQINPVEYATTRNRLSGAVTRLSPYITRGIISLPFVRDRLLTKHSPEDCAKLIQELAWREYFQNVWWDKEDDIFFDIRFSRDDWRHEGVVSALADANTGVDVIDDGIKELYETGYMHNHLRMWVASMSCNLTYAHWHTMGKWLYYHLIDGDLVSNFLSWQWVAGTSVNKRYTVNQKLINACSDIKQVRSILTYDRDDMLYLETPAELQAYEDFELKMLYPAVDPIGTVSRVTVLLYTPWTMDPLWRASEASARKILVIDPVWFDRYPVSELVLDFIIRQGKIVINDLELYVGSVKDIPGITDAHAYTLAHQTNSNWPVQFDEREKLFPSVSGYYKSFFQYWKEVEKSQK